MGVWNLEGGVSAQTVALEFEHPARMRERAVVRLHGEADRHQNPDIAEDEFRLLQILRAAGIPVPEPLFLDLSCDLFEIPYLVVSFIDGAPVLCPEDIVENARVMAEQLVLIHGADWSRVDLSFLPVQEEAVARKLLTPPESLDESMSEGRIRAALDGAWPLQQANPSTLLHGDFWPGNLLWNDGHLIAVIDWEDAATGDPLADLANGRLEILWAYGDDAMKSFTNRYRSLMPSLDYTNLPRWDLYGALHPAGKLSTWGLDAETEARMVAAHRRFVDQALDRLGDKST